jgi:hypothetical protein
MGPDFLCIGQQKAGTTWLYDQLQFHPDFWMPPVKELHYLSGGFPHAKMKTDITRAAGTPNKIRKWQDLREADHKRRLDKRDFAFFQSAQALVGRPFSLDGYDSLFVPKAALLSGDISPSYGPMRDEAIATTGARYPDLKVFFFVRDPIERTWSNINKSVRAGTVDGGRLSDVDYLTKLATSRAVNAQSRGTDIFSRWSKYVAPDRITAFLFDDIAEQPLEVLKRILAMLGVSAKPVAIEPAYDRKQDHAKIPMSSTARALLVEHYGDEVLACARVFGGAAAGWATRYGL